MELVKEFDVVTSDGTIITSFSLSREVDVKKAKELAKSFVNFNTEFLLDVEEKRVRMEFKVLDPTTNYITTIDAYTNEVMGLYRLIAGEHQDSDRDDLIYSAVHEDMMQFKKAPELSRNELIDKIWDLSKEELEKSDLLTIAKEDVQALKNRLDGIYNYFVEQIIDDLKTAYTTSEVTSGEFIYLEPLMGYEEMPEFVIRKGVQEFLDWDESEEKFNLSLVNGTWLAV